MWKFLLKDRYAQVFAVGFALLYVPHIPGILSPEGFRAYGDRYYDLLALFLVLVAILGGLGTLPNFRERRLWRSLAIAVGIWWFVRVLIALYLDLRWGTAFEMVAGGLYLAFYMVILYALGSRPHLEEREPKSPLVAWLEAAGILVFALALLVYFVIVPGVLQSGRYENWTPTLYLYLVLDLLVMGRFVLLAAGCRTVRWRTLYGLLALTALLWAANDGLQALAEGGTLSVEWGTLSYVLWALPSISLVAAARLRHYPFPGFAGAGERPAGDVSSTLGERFGSRLLIFGFAFPVIHFLFIWLGLMDPGSRRIHEAVVLGTLVILGGMAVIERMAFQQYGQQLERAREQAEAVIRERTERLNALIHNSPLGIVLLDKNIRVQMCNPAFEEMFQYTAEEAEGKSLIDLVAHSEELRAEAADIGKRMLTGEVIHVTQPRLRRDASTIEVEIYGVPLMVNGGMEGLFAIYQDVTERRSLESQLRQSQKMEAMGRLAGGVAHDFNNLLMVIRGYTEILPTLTDQPDRFQQYLGEIEKAADRAAGLTQQLLTFSRDRMVQTLTLDLNQLVAETGKMFRRVIGEDIEISTVLAPDLGPIQANRAQIEQVLLNLVVNAREAMPKGGKLKIETSNADFDASASEKQGDMLPGSYVVLSVTDTGVGFDKDILSRIFDPFFSTKSAGEGSGLGLATVYGISKQMGGFIRVQSAPGEGSTFRVHLPMAGGRPEAEVKPPKAKAAPKGQAETILIVEDELTVRRLTQDFLESQGYHVLEALESQEALRLVREHAGPIHLLLTDVVLPGLNGPELAEKVAALRPETQVLLMSGYSDESILESWHFAREAGFLQKPFTLGSLARKVRELIDGRK